MRARLALSGVAAAIVVAALVAAVSGGAGPARRAAPSLPREPLVGAGVTLASLRGKPALIDFFASWCGPCNAEAPAVRRAERALDGRARVVAVDWSDSRRYALAFVRRFRWSFPVLFDPNGDVGYAYGLQGLPNAFVLDSQGRIVRRLVGPQTARSLVRAVRDA